MMMTVMMIMVVVQLLMIMLIMAMMVDDKDDRRHHRCHRDDAEVDAVHTDRAANRGRVAPELVLPKLIAQDQDGVASRNLSFIREKSPAERRLDAATTRQYNHLSHRYITDQGPKSVWNREENPGGATYDSNSPRRNLTAMSADQVLQAA